MFTSTDSTKQGCFSLDGNGNYQGVLPAGSYIACVGRSSIQFLLTQSESLQLYNLGSLTVAGGSATGNYSIPATATLSGAITGGGLPSIPVGTSVTAADFLAPQITQLTCCYAPATSIGTPDLTGQYQLVLQQGRSFAAGVAIPIIQTTTSYGVINYPLNSTGTSLGGNTTLNFNIPNLPRRVSIFGRVTDTSGGAVADVVVSAQSQSITDAANVGYTVSGKTDATGSYSIAVLGGTN